MTSPSAETNEPEPPLLKRTEDCCRCSSHASVGSKPYLLLEQFRGRIVEQPHAFVSQQRGTAHRRQGHRREKCRPQFHGKVSRGIGGCTVWLMVARIGREENQRRRLQGNCCLVQVAARTPTGRVGHQDQSARRNGVHPAAGPDPAIVLRLVAAGQIDIAQRGRAKHQQVPRPAGIPQP